MDEHQSQNLRSEAAKAFMESLEQLEDILTPEAHTDESDAQIWEEAAEELDVFFSDNELSNAEVLDEESEQKS